MENQELPRRALDLSLAIYRVTAKFPNGEVLINQLRGIANEIVRDLTGGDFGCARKKIEVILNYFKISRPQKWVKDLNWLILTNEYQILTRQMVLEENLNKAGEIAEQKKTESPYIMSHNIESSKKIRKSINKDKYSLLPRQEKLLGVIRSNNQIKMADLIPLLKEVASERTIRNDLKVLLDQRLIKKEGINKTTKYSVV